ncbi:hypothetical protein [Rubinisphaera sp.]|uniref:hypothetical protein n=1 Tax=Rubinisphaera sp. TaxID=2024857 RepID=UPI000C111159|nr:hypothetical protein [Rubinisphaera sp.]MBV12241.1 hypothetical protein [Rubinisphaera sp.]HCS51191.1 hypothetical protein [Planctomycetaceae bacterium]|tara:strand:+ start:583 stop:1359 length:777 start_codon:yes stop_codon:yes gene_type:complete
MISFIYSSGKFAIISSVILSVLSPVIALAQASVLSKRIDSWDQSAGTTANAMFVNYSTWDMPSYNDGPNTDYQSLLASENSSVVQSYNGATSNSATIATAENIVATGNTTLEPQITVAAFGSAATVDNVNTWAGATWESGAIAKGEFEAQGSGNLVCTIDIIIVNDPDVLVDFQIISPLTNLYVVESSNGYEVSGTLSGNYIYETWSSGDINMIIVDELAVGNGAKIHLEADANIEGSISGTSSHDGSISIGIAYYIE